MTSARTVALLLWLVQSSWCERLVLKVFTTADGLTDNTARPLLASRRGYLWVASGPDLARFDGHTFRIYSTPDGWTGGRPLAMTETASGDFFIGAASGLYRFDPSAEAPRRFAPLEMPGPSNSVNQIFEDSRNRLWVASNGGVYRLDPGGPWRALSEIKPRGAQQQAVERFAEDAHGDIWAASYSGVYCFRRSGTVEHYSRSNDARLNDSGIVITQGPDGKIYAGTEGGLFRLARPSQVDRRAMVDRVWDVQVGLPSAYVPALAFWKGDLWLGTFRGLARIGRNGQVEAHTELAGIKDPPVETLLIDRSGSLWIGTDGAGLIRAVDRGFTNFGEADGLAFPRVEQILEDREGELVAISKSEKMMAVSRFNGRDGFETVKPRFSQGTTFPWAWSQIGFHSRDHQWWFGSSRGPVRFDVAAVGSLTNSSPAVVSEAMAGKGGYVFRLFEDAQGAIWVSRSGLTHNHLSRRDPVTGQWHDFGEAGPGGYDNSVAGFAEDNAGNIWVGCLTRVLYRYRRGAIEKVSGAEETEKGPRTFHVDTAGRLWIGLQYDGLLRVDDPAAENPAFRKYKTTDGLSSGSVLCLTSDANGNIYAGTARGIDRLDPATGRIRTYSTGDGLISGALRTSWRPPTTRRIALSKR